MLEVWMADCWLAMMAFSVEDSVATSARIWPPSSWLKRCRARTDPGGGRGLRVELRHVEGQASDVVPDGGHHRTFRRPRPGGGIQVPELDGDGGRRRGCRNRERPVCPSGDRRRSPSGPRGRCSRAWWRRRRSAGRCPAMAWARLSTWVNQNVVARTTTRMPMGTAMTTSPFARRDRSTHRMVRRRPAGPSRMAEPLAEDGDAGNCAFPENRGYRRPASTSTGTVERTSDAQRPRNETSGAGSVPAFGGPGGGVGAGSRYEARRRAASHALRSLRRSSSEVPPQMPDSWLVARANSRHGSTASHDLAHALGRFDLLDGGSGRPDGEEEVRFRVPTGGQLAPVFGVPFHRAAPHECHVDLLRELCGPRPPAHL